MWRNLPKPWVEAISIDKVIFQNAEQKKGKENSRKLKLSQLSTSMDETNWLLLGIAFFFNREKDS